MYLQVLRGWQMPYFGASSTIASGSQTAARTRLQPNTEVPLTAHERQANAIRRGKVEGIELLGAPPDVLYLYAYSTQANDSRLVNYGVNINRVPVVLTSLDITYPDDVDYLPTFANGVDATGAWDETSEPFPIKMDVNISLMETHSSGEYERFNLAQYKQGKMTNF
jgi:hypothetical protein